MVSYLWIYLFKDFSVEHYSKVLAENVLIHVLFHRYLRESSSWEADRLTIALDKITDLQMIFQSLILMDHTNSSLSHFYTHCIWHIIVLLSAAFSLLHETHPLIFHLLFQHKRHLQTTTKYVELIIVADNREVRRGHKLLTFVSIPQETISEVIC